MNADASLDLILNAMSCDVDSASKAASNASKVVSNTSASSASSKLVSLPKGQPLPLVTKIGSELVPVVGIQVLSWLPQKVEKKETSKADKVTSKPAVLSGSQTKETSKHSKLATPAVKPMSGSNPDDSKLASKLATPSGASSSDSSDSSDSDSDSDDEPRKKKRKYNETSKRKGNTIFEYISKLTPNGVHAVWAALSTRATEHKIKLEIPSPHEIYGRNVKVYGHNVGFGAGCGIEAPTPKSADLKPSEVKAETKATKAVKTEPNAQPTTTLLGPTPVPEAKSVLNKLLAKYTTGATDTTGETGVTQAPNALTSGSGKGPFDDPDWKEWIERLLERRIGGSKARRKRLDYRNMAIIDSQFFQVGDIVEYRGYANCCMRGKIECFRSVHVTIRLTEAVICNNTGAKIYDAGQRRRFRPYALINLSYRDFTNPHDNPYNL